MKTRFIVNARSGNAARALPAVRAFASRHGAEVVITQHSGHGAQLALHALEDGCDRIVAVGGDGTMNEVASVLIGTSAILGLIPCGSGDGLGRHLKIHGSVSRALSLLEDGHARLIDTGLADGHPFFTAAGIGFEAEIASRFNRLERRGFIRYLTTSATALREWTPQMYTIADVTGRTQVRAFTLAVANADQYGNNARIAPAAQVDDGMLDLTAVPGLTLANAIPLLVRLFAGRIREGCGVISKSAARFTVERERPGLLHTDGELHDAGRILEFQIRPSSLRIMTPDE